jgi:F0F1-type ATP synthase assembly protein I
MTPPEPPGTGDETDPGSDDMEPTKRRLGPHKEAVTGAFSKKTDFFSYVGSGLLIGLVLDWALGTGPWLTISWSLLAVGYGYWRLWRASGEIVAEMEKHSHGV